MKSHDKGILEYESAVSASDQETSVGRPARATIAALLPDGRVRIVETATGIEYSCRESAVAIAKASLQVGRALLVLPPTTSEGEGIIMGVLHDLIDGSLNAVDGGDVPDSLSLTARDALVLQVGDGSITIRKDGKILIKGTELVSHAKRMNRIKGGAVSIN